MDPYLAKVECLDQASKQVIQNLVNKRLKFFSYKKLHFIVLSASIVYSLIILYYTYRIGNKANASPIFDTVSDFIAEGPFLFLFFLGLVLFGSVKIFFEKMEKLNKEYNELRCEVIDKSKDLFEGEHWRERDSVYAYLKSKYDINLYHQSK